MIDLAAWYYKNLLGENQFIYKIEHYSVEYLSGLNFVESNVYLHPNLRPTWVSSSTIYNNCDGTGTDKYKNRAVYKAISEGLERLAFFELSDTQALNYRFDLNPTTTGMAAYPHFQTQYAKNLAFNEAVERWAIHEFNRGHLPVSERKGNKYFKVFEIEVPFNNIKVCILAYECEKFNAFSFAANNNLTNAILKAEVELNRNINVIKNYYLNKTSLDDTVDKTLIFFSSSEGILKFYDLVGRAPSKIENQNPKIICDKEMIGSWTKYTKVWRCLLEDSYFDCSSDHTFFMF